MGNHAHAKSQQPKLAWKDCDKIDRKNTPYYTPLKKLLMEVPTWTLSGNRASDSTSR